MSEHTFYLLNVSRRDCRVVESREPLNGVVDNGEHWPCDRNGGKGDDEEVREVHGVG